MTDKHSVDQENAVLRHRDLGDVFINAAVTVVDAQSDFTVPTMPAGSNNGFAPTSSAQCASVVSPNMASPSRSHVNTSEPEPPGSVPVPKAQTEYRLSPRRDRPHPGGINVELPSRFPNY